MTIKAAQTVDFLLHVAKMRKHLAAACGTDELFVRGPGAIAEMRRENYASFLGTEETLGPMTDKLVANSERLFVAFFDGMTTWSAGVEMELVSAWNLQEFVSQLADDDATNFRSACTGCAAGLIFAPEPVRFCSVSVPFLVAAVAPALYEVGN